MSEVRLVADSSACLPEDFARQYGIIIVPLAFLFDDELFRDGELSSREFYERLESAKRFPSTTSPSPGEFLEAFRRARDEGARTVLCLTLSSRYSGTHSAAANAREMATQELPDLDVRVVDTHGLAMTHGFAVLAAARTLKAGGSADAAEDAAVSVAARARMVGALDTTLYLARSGRVPWIVHWAASLLRIKPMLCVQDGAARPVGRPRTSAQAAEKLLRYLEEHAEPGEPLHAAVMHTDAEEAAQELARRIQERFDPAELIVTEFTSVMGVHTGPGFLGLAFFCGSEVPAMAGGAAANPRARADARRLENSLDGLPEPVARPAVVVMSGLPGSGKSTVRREIAGRYPMAVLESDALRRALFPQPRYTEQENARLWPAVHALMEDLLARGIPVIVDATNLKELNRRPLYRIAEKHGARLVIVQTRAPNAVVRKRLRSRHKRQDPRDLSEAGEEVYEQMKADAEPIRRRHIVVDTSKDMGAAVDSILRELDAIRV